MRRLMIVATLLVLLGPAAAHAQAVRVIADVDYVATAEYPNNKDRLDIYVPERAGRAPVIVSFHGGGLSQGDKSNDAFVGRRFASAGFVTVVPSYRLSPDVSHPAHIKDAAAAVAWTKRNIAKHGGDPDKLFVIGHSAGAYLAALLAFDPRYLAEHKLVPRDLKGVAPVSAFFYVDSEGVAPDRPKTVWGTSRETWVEASPATYVRADVPPLLLIYADGDEPWRRRQNLNFASELHAVKMRDATVVEVKDRTHSTVWSRMKEGEEETFRAIRDFITRVLKPGTSNNSR